MTELRPRARHLLAAGGLAVGLLTLAWLRPAPPRGRRPPPSPHYLAARGDPGTTGSPAAEYQATEPSSRCSPVQQVGFAKTHKTASSTVQNILLRWGLHSEWNWALHAAGSHLGPPGNQYVLNRPFRAAWLDTVPWRDMVEQQGYNSLALHTMWSRPEVERLLGPGARYITILREPVAQFESMYSYVHFERTLHMDIEQFVTEYVDTGRELPRVNGYMGRDQQLWDLGVTDTEDPAKVQAAVQRIDSEFHLVMIAEQFEESVVLLARELCWPLANLTSLRLNARKESKVTRLSASARARLARWLAADSVLYAHFAERLRVRLAAVGEARVADDVAELRRLNSAVRSECLVGEVGDTRRLGELFQPWSKDVTGYSMAGEGADCRYFALTEVHFIELVRRQQLARLDRWRAGG